jgi:type IV pilus assembly protein PilA
MFHVKRIDPGFSLIELMMAVAIVGILASLAIPQYQDYSTRAKLTEAVQILAAARIGIAEYAIAHGTMPATAANAGIDAVQSPVVEQLLYESKNGLAVLSAKLRNTGSTEVDGRIFSLIGEYGGRGAVAPAALPGGGALARGVISWRCVTGDAAGKQAVPARFLPANCRNLTT